MTRQLAGVVVTYYPDLQRLEATLARLGPELTPLVVVDNSDDPDVARAVESCCREAGALLLAMKSNIGIAAAQNWGIRESLQRNATHVLFLDDDSELTAGAPTALLAAFDSLRVTRPNVVAMGPRVKDRRTGEFLTFAWRGRHIRQLRTADDHDDFTDSAFLLGSGAVVVAEAFETVGLFREEYFIDHVDKEWGLRAGASGFASVVTSSVTLLHSLGDTPDRDASGSAALYTHRSPVRDYYLTRNAFLLFRDLDLPRIRFVGMFRLLAEQSVRKVAHPVHPGQRRAVLRGVADGLRGRSGPLGRAVTGKVGVERSPTRRGAS